MYEFECNCFHKVFSNNLSHTSRGDIFILFNNNIQNNDKNLIYVSGLMETLGGLCDKYIMSGSPKTVRTIILGYVFVG